jgi:hypothetical protein
VADESDVGNSIPPMHRAQFITDDGHVGTCTVIILGGLPWLVPWWIDSPDGRSTRPARIVGLAWVEHQRIERDGQTEFVVNQPLPKALFENPIPLGSVTGYVVLEGPNIQFPIPS